jgi:hypothetical protein
VRRLTWRDALYAGIAAFFFMVGVFPGYAFLAYAWHSIIHAVTGRAP